MVVLQITPGAGRMYCGACMRDNALARELRRQGHEATLLPLYLPLTLDEQDQSRGLPVFFGGINVYLEQKSALYRRLPRFLTRALDSRWLLRLLGRWAGRTRPEDVGALAVSMLRGEDGNQAVEMDRLLDWLATVPRPGVVNLSNVLLAGLARPLKQRLKAPVAATLQGEDAFLDALPEPYRAQAWEALSEQAGAIDAFIAPSRYFGRLMQERIGFPEGRLHIAPNGIDLSGYEAASTPPSPPALGYFARMCPQKGLDTLVDSYILLRSRPEGSGLRLAVGGSLGPEDRPFVEGLEAKLRRNGLGDQARFAPNLSRVEKAEFLKGLSVFSVPSRYGESFGLYLVEALAAGVPVVAPRHAAFPEILEQTGGGVLCPPSGAEALADGIASLLGEPDRARSIGQRGREAVRERFSVEAMARRVLEIYESL